MRLPRTRVGSASLPQKRGSNYRWKKLIFWLGKAARLNFLRRTRQGAVPVLELDDGSCLSESVAICRYMEGLRPEPNLLGRDLREQAEMERWNRRMELELFAPIVRAAHK